MALTTRLMHELEQPIKAPDGEKAETPFDCLTVSAGILFVHYTFPYVRARELADTVRREAKKQAMKFQQADKPPPSALNWWVNRQAAMERSAPLWKVAGEPGSTLKPYLLRPLPESYVGTLEPSWRWLETTLLGESGGKTGLWNIFADSRNKVKTMLAEVSYRDGWRRQERLFLVRPLNEDTQPLQWLEQETAFCEAASERRPAFLLDAGELFDIHFPLPCEGEMP